MRCAVVFAALSLVTSFANAATLHIPEATLYQAEDVGRYGWTPRPTQAPGWYDWLGLRPRAALPSGLTDTCGWYGTQPLTCGAGLACAFAKPYMGCCGYNSNGTLTDCVVQTTCLNQAQDAASCAASGCNAAVGVCTGTNTACVTWDLIISTATYSSFRCGLSSYIVDFGPTPSTPSTSSSKSTSPTSSKPPTSSASPTSSAIPTSSSPSTLSAPSTVTSTSTPPNPQSSEVLVTSTLPNPFTAPAPVAPSSTVTLTIQSSQSIIGTPIGATTGSSTSTSTPVPTTSKKSDTAAIAGGVVGGVAGLAIIGGLIAFALYRNKKRKADEDDRDYNPAPENGRYTDSPVHEMHSPGSPSYNVPEMSGSTFHHNAINF